MDDRASGNQPSTDSRDVAEQERSRASRPRNGRDVAETRPREGWTAVEQERPRDGRAIGAPLVMPRVSGCEESTIHGWITDTDHGEGTL